MPVITETRMTRTELIAILMDLHGFKCYMCPEPFDEDRHSVTIDHVTPLSKDGTWDLDNLMLCGLSCNQEKGDRMWLEDGTLEPRPFRGPTTPHVDKDRILSEVCELCFNGRLLMPDESCPDCFRGASPMPWSMKRKPSECTHSGYDWCWMDASGIIDRTPAIVYVLDGEYLDD
jgi:hypothetical protein